MALIWAMTWGGGTHRGRKRRRIFKAIFRNNLTRLEITSEVKNNLKRAIFDLVLKGIFRALLKIALENKNNL